MPVVQLISKTRLPDNALFLDLWEVGENPHRISVETKSVDLTIPLGTVFDFTPEKEQDVYRCDKEDVGTALRPIFDKHRLKNMSLVLSPPR